MPRTCRRIRFFLNIPKRDRNGIILHYNVTYIENGLAMSTSSERFKNYVQWEMDMDSDTKIQVSAHTKLGSSPIHHRLLPGLNNPSLIQSTPKVWGEENLEETEIKIGWEAIEKIENIRLVYCTNSSECRSGIFFQNVNTSLTEYVWKKPDVSTKYFLALSFTRKHVPQMTDWICLYGHYIPSKVFIKQVSSEANALHVEWIDGFCHSYRRAKITNYKLQYCLQDNNLKPCKTIVVNNTEPRYRIVNLKPYSLYEIRLAAISEAGEGEISDTFEQQTLEGKPETPPYDLRAGQITGNSVQISFKPPTQPNGIITKYTVYVFKEFEQATLQTFNHNRTDVLVTNLLGNAKYFFRIRAENSSPFPSEYSEEISVVTMTRAASRLMASQIRYHWPKDKSNLVEISWDEPTSPNGNISEYRLTWNGTMTGNQTIPVPERSASIAIPEDCKHVSLNLAIESVTYLNEEEFRSEQSEAITINGYYISVPKQTNDLLNKTIGGTIGVAGLLNRKVCKPFRIYQIFSRRGRQGTPINEAVDDSFEGTNIYQTDSLENYNVSFHDNGREMLLELQSADSHIPNNLTAEPSHTYVDSPS
ncbi:DgyrCDS1023 [Dimorphilus gyrociliatus]|uniref:DgyrCDS1023 n=1 Tax=Dimorphilus gyrociliatus TaxID=2664684 RepID=A0A7I8VB23_9ANNE|nr:DgyrCDS1023 [Dimorphilus gyrociliatus]